jgi:hypothetical protein
MNNVRRMIAALMTFIAWYAKFVVGVSTVFSWAGRNGSGIVSRHPVTGLKPRC